VTGRRSERQPRAAASVAAVGKLSRAMMAVARLLQQEGGSGCCTGAGYPRSPLGHGWALAESHGTQGSEVV
jgi:hypothetical protein